MFETILTSAVVSAIVSGIVSVIAVLINQRNENERQNLNIAAELLELKDEQMRFTVEKYRQAGKDVDFAFFDPATELAGYLKAVKEIRRTGKWEKGEAVKEKYQKEKGQMKT